MKDFTDFNIPNELIKALSKQNIIKPTKVQSLVIPQLFNKKNIIFRSDTGTGKTLCFLIPAFLNIKTNPEKQNPQIIILAPTNELASQIKNEAQNLAKLSESKISSVLFIGSSSIKRQIDYLKSKPQIIVGTPARIIQLIRLKKLKPQNVNTLILDEADRLLSREMQGLIKEIFSLLPKEKQLIACSATMNESYKNQIEKTTKLKNIELFTLESENILEKKIEHWAFWCEQREKINFLRSFLKSVKPHKALIFTSLVNQVPNISSKLKYHGINVSSLHSKLDQQKRKTAIDSFKSGKIPYLVTSDLAARGLDILDVSHIIQLDVNENDDFFVHRTGRTARAGKEGINVIVGDAKEMQALSRIEKKLNLVIFPKELYKGKVISPRL